MNDLCGVGGRVNPKLYADVQDQCMVFYFFTNKNIRSMTPYNNATRTSSTKIISDEFNY